jgi:1,4-dihydroxy-2-naphthoate octaprenyltransferase
MWGLAAVHARAVAMPACNTGLIVQFLHCGAVQWLWQLSQLPLPYAARHTKQQQQQQQQATNHSRCAAAQDE